MSVKVIDSIPYEKVENKRMESLKRDIREIIDNRIAVCEIIEPPYPQSSMRDKLKRAIRTILWEYVTETADGKRKYPNYNAFEILSKKIDGVVHWYIKFDADVWEKGE